jgi:hypothetical protein
MGSRRPEGEREFNPLDDSADLISQVVSGNSNNQFPKKMETPQPIQEKVIESKQKIVEIKKTFPSEEAPKTEMETSQKEESVVFKFNVPRSDYVAAKRIVSMLETELNARIDLSNLGRGWLTRLITSEKEILEAAKHQQKLRTPNSRDPLQVAEVDHSMAVVQSVAFRRADPVK